MWDKEKERLLLALRGGVALGLGLVALWVVGLTVDGTGVRDKLEQLSSSPSVTVALLAQQTGVPPEELDQSGLTGWGKWVIRQSAWLKAGTGWERDGGERPDDLDLPEQPEPDPESGETTLTAPQQEHTDVLEMTSRGEDGPGVVSSEGVYLLNKTDRTVEVSELEGKGLTFTQADGPQILILHTHGSEAYTQAGEDTYEESDPYRTTDCTKNVVRVGEEMAMELRAHGFRVLHDTNLYDYPSYNGAYDRSGAAVEQWLEQYPSIQIILDVHRDALVGEEGQPYKLVSTEAGNQVAQVMLVLGSDAGGNEHPNWRENLTFAAWLQRGVVKSCSSLARPMVLRSSRYNQHLASGSILVEVGGHGNTLQEAIDGARLWSDSVARTLKEMGVK